MNTGVGGIHIKCLIRMQNGVDIGPETFSLHFFMHVGFEFRQRHSQMFVRQIFLKALDDFLAIQVRERLQHVIEVVEITSLLTLI